MEDKKCERCEFYIIAEDTEECLITGKAERLEYSCDKYKKRSGNHFTVWFYKTNTKIIRKKVVVMKILSIDPRQYRKCILRNRYRKSKTVGIWKSRKY